MIDLNFSREFFAAMLVTEVEKVGFAVLIRTFPDAMSTYFFRNSDSRYT